MAEVTLRCNFCGTPETVTDIQCCDFCGYLFCVNCGDKCRVLNSDVEDDYVWVCNGCRDSDED